MSTQKVLGSAWRRILHPKKDFESEMLAEGSREKLFTPGEGRKPGQPEMTLEEMIADRENRPHSL